MTKVCFFSVQWLEEARYTADNLLIAKKMYDYGKPLSQDLSFYVKNSNNDSSLFYESLKVLFSVISQNEVEDERHETKEELVVTNQEILKWLDLTNKIQNTSMFEAFRMVQKGLESLLSTTSHHFEGELEGELVAEGLRLTIHGTSYYLLFYEFLDSIFGFLKGLKEQLQIWEEHYDGHIKGSQRNTYHAS